MDALPRTARLGAGLLILIINLAACTAGGSAPSAAPSSPPSAAPSDGPVSAPPADPSIAPPVGAKPILPKPGTAVNLRAMPAESLAARVNGSTIIVQAVWTSGVEPCTILDSIVVDKGEGTYTITLREGDNPQEMACIAIAEQHVTEFEIPDVAAGTWTIRDSGGVAPPVEVTVG